jgi:hypothetical protein
MASLANKISACDFCVKNDATRANASQCERCLARFAAGADAVQTFETKANALLTQANAYRELCSSLAH